GRARIGPTAAQTKTIARQSNAVSWASVRLGGRDGRGKSNLRGGSEAEPGGGRFLYSANCMGKPNVRPGGASAVTCGGEIVSRGAARCDGTKRCAASEWRALPDDGLCALRME